MKQSKTTLKELTHRYRAVLLKCALLNLAAFAVAMPAKAEDYPFKGDLTIDSDTQLSEEALYGNITITGGNVSISDNKEIAVVNTFSASGETTKLTISKGAGVYSQKNISLSDKVKVFLERGNSTGNDGWLKAKDSFSANNAQIDINYGDFGASRSDETQSAHTTTTIIDSTVNILGGYGWMYAEDISVSGNSTINVLDGAELVVTKAIGTCPDDKCTELKDALSYEETGTIDLKDSAAINLSGTMTGNIAAMGGAISFNNNSALNGKITGQLNKLTIAGGTFNDENNLVIDGSEDITVSGGTIISNNRGAVLQHQGTGNIVVTGGTFNNNTDREANDIVHLGSGDIKISGGTFNNSVIYKPVSCANGYGYESCFDSSTPPAAGKIEISGGVFNNAELNSDSTEGISISNGTFGDSSIAANNGDLIITGGSFKDNDLEGKNISIDSDKADLTLNAGKLLHSIDASRLTITGEKGISIAKTVVKSDDISGKIIANKDSFVGRFTEPLIRWNVSGTVLPTVQNSELTARNLTVNEAKIVLNADAKAGIGMIDWNPAADANGNYANGNVSYSYSKSLSDNEINTAVKTVADKILKIEATTKNIDDLGLAFNDALEAANVDGLPDSQYIKQQWKQGKSVDIDKIKTALREAYNNYNKFISESSAKVNIAKSEITMNGTAGLMNGSAKDGNIVVSDNSTITAKGTNTISAKSGTVSFADSKLIVSNGANLTVATKDGNTLNLTNSTVDLSGTLNGNLNGGTLKFNSANARLNGAIDGAVDIKFNDDFTLSKSTITGRIHDLGDVAVADGKHLTAHLETFGKNLPDDDLNMKSFVMGKNAKLTLTGNDSLEAEDLDIEASDKVYLTGQINVNNAGVKLGNIADANVSPDGTYTIENATLSTTGNLTEFAARSNEDMVVKNSILNFGSQRTYFGKDSGTSGDVVLEATKVTSSGGLHLDNEIGGNIRFTNGSTISLNASDNLIIGNEKNYSGKGSIIADNSSLVLNGTKVFVGQEADDALKLQNKASMTANGTVSVKTIDGKTGLISVADSSLNIGGTLEGNVSFIGNGTLNLSGTLNGNVNIANTAEISYSADAFSKINGTVTNNGTISLTGGTLSKGLSGNVKVAENTAFGGSFTVNDLTISTGKTLDIGANNLTASTITGGTISAILTDAAKNTAIITANATDVTLKLDMSAASRDEVTKYKITDGTGFTFGDYASNRYAVSSSEFTLADAKTIGTLTDWNGGDLYILRLATASEAAIEDLEAAGVKLPENEKNASKILDLANDVLDKLSDSARQNIEKVNDLLDRAAGNAEQVSQILREIAPDASTSGSKTASNTAKSVINVINSRFGGSARKGRSGGDYAVGQASVWAQGMMNYAKLDTDNGFSAHSNGFAAGFEANFTDSFKAGVGYAYTSTDISTERSKTDVETHTGFVYGEYKPNKAYVNGIVSFGRSDYDDKTRGLSLTSDYKADTIAAQIAAGYKAGVLTPEAAVRFTNVKQKAYTDAMGAKMAEKTSDTWTGVLGAKIGQNYKLRANRKIGLSPELKVAATYDFARDDENRTVTLPDGSSYTATGEAMERFGVEAGAGLTLNLGNATEIALTYDGKFKKDYQDHTGMVNLKLKF